jgi:dihydrofolate synthase/folylpolyglutamate synthase
MFQRVGPVAYKKDLGNIRLLCEELGNPQEKCKTIHIAGTNGKGTVSNLLSALLQARGHRTGLYTSPHLVDFRERIRVDGIMCPEEFVTEFVARHKSLIEQVEPSFFEITVAMAFAYFEEQGCEIAVIETGLGGRLDSTNIITPLLSVITNIGWDHMNMLGDTLPAIAGEKAGIIKSGVPVLIGEYQEEVDLVFREKATQTGSAIYHATDLAKVEKRSGQPGSMSLRCQCGGLLLEAEVELSGQYQINNIRTALAAVLLLPDEYRTSAEQMTHALEHVRELTGFIGRMDVLKTSPLVIADCAHNKDGMRALWQSIDVEAFNRIHVVYGTVNDKDPSPVWEIFPSAIDLHLCRPDIPRGKSVNELATMAQNLGFQYQTHDSVVRACEAAISFSGPDDLVLICGSIFVVAELYTFDPGWNRHNSKPISS